MQTSIPKYNKAEIHYSLIPHYWNKAYAFEAGKDSNFIEYRLVWQKEIQTLLNCFKIKE
jgi:hypothetical protein